MTKDELLYDEYINETIDRAEHSYDSLIAELDKELDYWLNEFKEVD